jgi:hypothetical protein
VTAEHRPPLELFRRGGQPLMVPVITADPDDDRDTPPRIRCPQCDWQPGRSSRWSCLDHRGYPEYFSAGCGMSWNTFDTRGRCPGCSYQWRWTICLACARWSRHQDWYKEGEPRTRS